MATTFPTNPTLVPTASEFQDIILRQELELNSEMLMDKLTPLEADIFVEYGHNSSYKEISQTLSVPAKCVDNALTRIRKKASEVYVQFKDDENNDATHKKPKGRSW